MYEKLRKAEPGLLMAWMVSACIAGIGFGALLANTIGVYAIWVFGVAGLIHLWAMYSIYVRK